MAIRTDRDPAARLLGMWMEVGDRACRDVLAPLGLCPRLERLFAAAACRGVWPLLSDGRSRAAVVVAERFADGRATVRERRDAALAARSVYRDLCSTFERGRDPALGAAAMAARAALHAVETHANAAGAADYAAHAVASDLAGGDPADRRAAREYQGRVLVALTGRGWVFDPAWRTSAAVGIAGHCYESGDWSGIPVLADALQDAGCEDQGVLGYCRGSGPHVRGCWVVDLILGKR